MPRGDRTGPGGFGPMTGRGAGYCAGYAVPGYMNPGMRGGMGYGRGRGRGFGRMHYWGGPGWGGPGYGAGAYGPGYAPVYGPGYAPYPAGYPTVEEERELLSRQVEALENELQFMRQRMQELSEEGGD